MAVRRRKVKRFVIDVNTYVAIFINGETEWLVQYVIQNKIELFVDNNLIEELLRVLDYPRIKKRLHLAKHIYANFVLLISTPIIASPFQVNSPDKEDNYLYDIALTAHAKLLVTGEKALLNWGKSPVKAINLATFKELF
jgi:putative PIN family toxin of toxin-antitoxin system